MLLFIPMYNCGPQIQRVLEKVAKCSSYFHDILLVDNRSTDSTTDKVKSFLEASNLKATILINNQNVNLGGSHKVAFNYALEHGYSHVIVLHGDDQADIAELVPLLNSGLHEKFDCLLGARFHPQSRLIGYSKFRIFGNLVLNILCSIVCKRKILDMGAGLNIYSRRFFSDKSYLSFPNDLTFNVFLLFHTCFKKYKFQFFPITWKEEDQISNAKVFRQMRIIVMLCLKVLWNPNLIYSNDPYREFGHEIYFKT